MIPFSLRIQSGRVQRTMVELETRFEVQGRKLLTIGWFEGSGTGRVVLDGPNDEREEVQVAGLDASLLVEVQEAMSEPPPPVRPGTAAKVHVRLDMDGARVTRSMEFKGSGTLLDELCVKLLGMAEMMVQGEKLKKIVAALKARAR